jgi:septum site-determining protein MinD
MGRVYAVASAKGGVGKTTLTANLGVTLAAAGLDVAVVDADLGMPNLARLVGVSPDGATLHDVLAGDAEPLDAVYEGPEGVAVVPGDGTLDAYAAVDPRALRTVVDALAAYDVVLLDTGAGLSHDTVLPLGLADSVVLVSTPSPDAFGDTKKTKQLADHLDVPVAGLVVTRLDREGVDTDGMASHLGVPLLGVVPEDPLDADSTGGLAATRDADSTVAAAYRALAASVAPDDADLDLDAPAAPDTDDGDERVTVDDEADVDGEGDTDHADDDGVVSDEGDESDVSHTDVDLASALDDTDGPVDDLDDAFDLDDDAANADEAADDDEDGVANEDEGDTVDADGDDTADGDGDDDENRNADADDEEMDENEDEPAAEETPVDADASTGTSAPASATDVVVEAEPARDEGEASEASSDADDADVTIEPGDAEITDAESDVGDARASEGESADGDETDDDETGEQKKGGLFGRFFG